MEIIKHNYIYKLYSIITNWNLTIHKHIGTFNTPEDVQKHYPVPMPDNQYIVEVEDNLYFQTKSDERKD